MQTENLVNALVARDAGFARWAVVHTHADLASVWEKLDDDTKDWLVESGVVGTVVPDVDCYEAQPWADDWRRESGASWPTYDLRVTAPGMAPIEVQGWHLVGPCGPDGKRRYKEWGTEDSYGCQGGTPAVDGWAVDSGDNVDGGGPIPCWLREGRWVTLDREALGGSLSDAADEADHGSEPTWEDVTDMDATYAVHVLVGGAVHEVNVLCGYLAADDSGDETTYWAEAWSHGLDADTLFRTEADAVSDLRGRADDEATHPDEDEARVALGGLALRARDVPDGLEAGIDADGLWVSGEDAGERYHPTADQLSTVVRSGWMPVIDDILGAIGVRAGLGAARQWQVEMDAVIAESDPWVTLGDSTAGGNCAVGTDSFAGRLAHWVGAVGPCGAARASLILSLRDDSYTRRACRLAAQRTLAHA